MGKIKRKGKGMATTAAMNKMKKLRALNDELGDTNSNDQQKGLSKEAQEAETSHLYKNALQLLSEGKKQDAKTALEKLLNSPSLQFDKLGVNTCSDKAQLRLTCLKSLSSIYRCTNSDSEERIPVLKEAADLDAENINTWYWMGEAATKSIEFDLAKHAYMQVLHRNPLHWKSLENIIPITYVRNEFLDCLEYCAIGLENDSTFTLGMVFRDYILQMNPCILPRLTEYFPDRTSLTTCYTYDSSLKELYLTNLKEMIKKQKMKNTSATTTASQDRESIAVDSISSLSQLCKFVNSLYKKLVGEQAILKELYLEWNTSEPSEAHQNGIAECIQDQGEPIINSDEPELPEETNETSQCRRSASDENEGQVPSSENGVDMETSQSLYENCANVSADADNPERSKEVEEEKAPKKKWWELELEGKRRSQRVRGLSTTPSQSAPVKEQSFGDRLRSLIPESLLLLNEEESLVTNTPQLQPSKEEDNYFATPREVADVENFLKDNPCTTISDLVVRFITFLSLKNEVQWPQELVAEYFELYAIYRSFVPYLSLHKIKDSDQDTVADSMILLTKLELQSDRKITPDTNEMLQLQEFANSTEDKVFRARYGWLRAGHCIMSGSTENDHHNDAMHYLNFVHVNLADKQCRIPRTNHNVISAESIEALKKLIRQLDNVKRVKELYDHEKYEELIEALQDDGDEEMEPWDQYYLVDANFKLGRLTESIQPALKLVNYCVKSGTSESVLSDCIQIMEKVCTSSGQLSLSVKTIKQVILTMIDLLISIDMKNFTDSKLWTLPWCILHSMLKKSEKEEPFRYLLEDTTPSSVLVLKFAHEYLSRFKRCLEYNAKLPRYTLETLVKESEKEEYKQYEETKTCVEQAIFCLYCFPTKKPRKVIDHNHDIEVEGLELNDCEILYHYYQPKDFPEFDSYGSIGSELETLFQKILGVIPPQVQPAEAVESLQTLLAAEVEHLDTEAIIGSHAFPKQFLSIYYLLADHYFKSKDWDKAIQFYTWDLALNITRFDSWAAMALAKAEVANSKIDSFESVVQNDVVCETRAVIKCFRKALELEPSNTKLGIEFGSFVYAMAANYNRYFKKFATKLSEPERKALLAKRLQFLQMASECFAEGTKKPGMETNEDECSDQSQQEGWLQHYMLGKVTEKLHPDMPDKFLAQYEIAGQLLHEQNAAYPAKITFNNCQHLAVEALEIYYRIHASIMNYIRRYYFLKSVDYKLLQEFLDRAAASPFMQAKLAREADSKKKKSAEDEEDPVAHLTYTEDPDYLKLQTEEQWMPSDPDAEPCSPDYYYYQYPEWDAEWVSEYPLFGGRFGWGEIEKSERWIGKNGTWVPVPSKKGIKINSLFWRTKFPSIISQCVRAFEECVSRFPNHHKAIFRISYTYYTYPADTLQEAETWLLGEDKNFRPREELKKIRTPALFQDRKPNNFFHGIYRSPVDDIDRPGSFAYHMSKAMHHLIEIVGKESGEESDAWGTPWTSFAADLALQLSKVPDPDKQYLYKADRRECCTMVANFCATVCRKVFHDYNPYPDPEEFRSLKSTLYLDIRCVIQLICEYYIKLQKLDENPLDELIQVAHYAVSRRKRVDEVRDYMDDKAFLNKIKTLVTPDQALRYFQQRSPTGFEPLNANSQNTQFTYRNSTEEQINTSSEDLLAIELPDVNIPRPELLHLGYYGMLDGSKDEDNEELVIPAICASGGPVIPAICASGVPVNPTEGYSASTAQLDPIMPSCSNAITTANQKINKSSGSEGQPLAKGKSQNRKRRTNASKKTNSINPPPNQKSTVRNKRESKVLSQPAKSSGKPYPALTFNTSPYRAGTNILLGPKEYCQSDAAPNASDGSPPKAHCNSRTILSSGNSPDVIDFSGKFSGDGSAVTMHPEVAVQGSNREAIEIPRTQREPRYPLPPKKKRTALNLFQADPLTIAADDDPQPGQQDVITLD